MYVCNIEMEPYTDKQVVLPTAMTGKSHLNLAPPLVDSGQSESLAKADQAICASLSPHDNSLAVYVTREVRVDNSRLTVEMLMLISSQAK